MVSRNAPNSKARSRRISIFDQYLAALLQIFFEIVVKNSCVTVSRVFTRQAASTRGSRTSSRPDNSRIKAPIVRPKT
jgi:hypothetical protein